MSNYLTIRDSQREVRKLARSKVSLPVHTAVESKMLKSVEYGLLKDLTPPPNIRNAFIASLNPGGDTSWDLGDPYDQ